MATYRIYFVQKGTEHAFAGEPKIVECADDNEARQKARQYMDGKDIELWEGKRFLARIPSAD